LRFVTLCCLKVSLNVTIARLHFADYFLGLALYFQTRVSSDLAGNFLDLAFHLIDSAFALIFVHNFLLFTFCRTRLGGFLVDDPKGVPESSKSSKRFWKSPGDGGEDIIGFPFF